MANTIGHSFAIFSLTFILLLMRVYLSVCQPTNKQPLTAGERVSVHFRRPFRRRPGQGQPDPAEHGAQGRRVLAVCRPRHGGQRALTAVRCWLVLGFGVGS